MYQTFKHLEEILPSQKANWWHCQWWSCSNDNVLTVWLPLRVHAHVSHSFCTNVSKPYYFKCNTGTLLHSVSLHRKIAHASHLACLGQDIASLPPPQDLPTAIATAVASAWLGISHWNLGTGEQKWTLPGEVMLPRLHTPLAIDPGESISQYPHLYTKLCISSGRGCGYLWLMCLLVP